MPTAPTRINGTPANFEKDSAEARPFTLGALPAEQRKQTELAIESAKALMLKALLHRDAPADYPIADGDSAEGRVAKVVADLDDESFAVLRPRIRALAADRARLSAFVGPRVDLRKPLVGADKIFVKRPAIKIAPPPKKPKYSRVSLSLRKLHCVDETNPEGGADDMVLGGVLVHPDGKASAIKSFVAGSFDDGNIQDYGILHLGQCSLGVTNGYPKTVYCTWLLVESDQDDADAAKSVTTVCNLVAGLATALGQPVVAAAAAFVGGMIGVFGALISDDKFPPYGSELRLDNEDGLGADGVANFHTGNIRGHGGTYRIGYRWVLSA